MSKMEREIAKELCRNRSAKKKDAFRLSVLRSLYPRLFNDSTTIGVLRINLKSYVHPKHDEICIKYEALNAQLNESFTEQSTPTSSERILRNKLHAVSKCEFLPSIWIGRKNVDLFAPTLSGFNRQLESFCGVAIEVDGPIHDLWPKALKDNHKEELLHWMNILTLRVKNADIAADRLKFLNTRYYFRPTDTRAKRRIWLKIYLVTIFLNASDQDIESLFQCNLSSLAKEFRHVSTEKKPCL
ncbi:MAG: hypothetical protein OM95_14660 [Bdellovibrio sp. ArHS]|uniref:hypothetical protein n=1 Tax=Bdellovibrio sp. ArHS TaxID=1569284 RepID=UPI0005833DF5|nr:hypothetical protein [Bdellovibrio sp. ArHS]KHD87422.1 MAG: hypothetical protein OM95_14660 [Bdellovibrio sp. ArHS]